MKLGKFSVFVILCFFLNFNHSKAEKKYSTNLNSLENKSIIVDIKALDKITAKIFDLSIKIGDEKIFGNLKIKPLKCKNTNINSLHFYDSSIIISAALKPSKIPKNELY